jgi:glycine cleavage system H protein
MSKRWRNVRIRQELVEEMKKEMKKSQYQSLSEFASEAIRNRLQALTKERVSEYLERDRSSRTLPLQAQLLYAPTHIWAQVTPQGNVKIGVTEYFQGQLKEIVNIRTDEAGEEVSKGEPFGVVETWWFTHDLYSPLNGRIVSVNKTIIDDPFTLNADPYRWIVEVKPEDSAVNSWMSELLNSGEYRELVIKLEGRLH